MSTATIDPEQIRKELSNLWLSLGKESEGSAGVLRACSMTVIAVVDEADDPAQVSETIAMLMREHPSRSIVVRVRNSQEHLLSSRVLAQCWMPFGDRRQICCEEVEIVSSLVSMADLPAVILPLAVADLPVILWCSGSFGMEALAGLADKVILDSAAAGGIDRIIQLAKRHRVADLAWVRLTRWRDLIAQIFENKANLAELPNLTRVRIAYEGAVPSTSSFYMAAWLGRNDIAWERGPRTSVSLETADGQVYAAIRTTSEETGVDLEVRGNVTRTVIAKATDYTLLREELSLPGPDPVFDSVLPRAAALAAQFEKGGSRG